MGTKDCATLAFHTTLEYKIGTNLSIPGVLFRDLGLPTVPQGQRDTHTCLHS